MITPSQLAQVGEATLLVSPLYQPAFSVQGHDLYLISGASGHCLALTNDATAATGILIAAKVDDE